MRKLGLLLVIVLSTCLFFPTRMQTVYGMAGSGTEVDPYIVMTFGDLESVHSYSMDTCYRLGANIDASATDNETGWSPLGIGGDAFTGTFDGSGYSISNLCVIGDPSEEEWDYSGFFGLVFGATITDLTLIDVYYTGSSYVSFGGLVGYSEESTISGCSVSGEMNFTYDSEDSPLVGGLVGASYYSNSENCTSGVSITISGSPNNSPYVGGFVSSSEGDNFSGCSYTCTITDNTSDFESEVGGFVWYSTGSEYLTCFSDIDITGGLVGGFIYSVLDGSEDNVTNCYSIGSISSPDSSGGYSLAGFSCCPTDYELNLDRCYSAVVLTGEETDYLAGFNWDNATTSNCYWDEDIANSNYASGGTGRTTAQMKTEGTYVDWDFESVWLLGDCNSGYPCLVGVTPNCEEEEPPSSPLKPTSFTFVSSTVGSIELSWNSGENSEKTMVRYKTTPFVGAASAVTEGTLGYFGSDNSCTISSLGSGTTYYFRAWGWNDA